MNEQQIKETLDVYFEELDLASTSARKALVLHLSTMTLARHLLELVELTAHLMRKHMPEGGETIVNDGIDRVRQEITAIRDQVKRELQGDPNDLPRRP